VELGTQLVALARLVWSLHIWIPKDFMYYRDHFISTILSLTVSYLALSYMLPQPVVTVGKDFSDICWSCLTTVSLVQER